MAEGLDQRPKIIYEFDDVPPFINLVEVMHQSESYIADRPKIGFDVMLVFDVEKWSGKPARFVVRSKSVVSAD